MAKIATRISQPGGRPVGQTFKLYDLQTASEGRWRTERGMDYRLEHYYFHCRRKGYEFEFQEGWFKGSWEQFVDAFIAAYPASDYFISRDELYNNATLKSFLGF